MQPVSARVAATCAAFWSRNRWRSVASTSMIPEHDDHGLDLLRASPATGARWFPDPHTTMIAALRTRADGSGHGALGIRHPARLPGRHPGPPEPGDGVRRRRGPGGQRAHPAGRRAGSRSGLLLPSRATSGSSASGPTTAPASAPTRGRPPTGAARGRRSRSWPGATRTPSPGGPAGRLLAFFQDVVDVRVGVADPAVSGR